MRDLTRAWELGDRSVTLAIEQANGYHRLRLDDKALAAADRALAIQPACDAAFNLRACVKAASQDFPGALEEFDRACVQTRIRTRPISTASRSAV